MVVQDIRKLLEKLNEYCTGELEKAVGTCVSRGHYEVRFEHILMNSMQNTDNDIAHILRHFDIDTAHLNKGLNAELEKLKTGNTGKPSFSPLFLDILEQAWSLSSLQLSQDKISSGTLLLAALERGIPLRGRNSNSGHTTRCP